jgi:hypothetical protein
MYFIATSYLSCTNLVISSARKSIDHQTCDSFGGKIIVKYYRPLLVRIKSILKAIILKMFVMTHPVISRFRMRMRISADIFHGC